MVEGVAVIAKLYWVLWPFLVGGVGLMAVYGERLLPSRRMATPAPRPRSDEWPRQYSVDSVSYHFTPDAAVTRHPSSSSLYTAPRHAAE